MVTAARAFPFVLLGAILSAATAGCRTHEPTDAQLRKTLEQHRDALDTLRQMFEEDVKRHQLLRVSALGTAECKNPRDDETCLSAARRRAYQTSLEGLRVQAVERHETPGIYFHVYRSTFWANGFRFRGLVYSLGRQLSLITTTTQSDALILPGAGTRI